VSEHGEKEEETENKTVGLGMGEKWVSVILLSPYSLQTAPLPTNKKMVSYHFRFLAKLFLRKIILYNIFLHI